MKNTVETALDTRIYSEENLSDKQLLKQKNIDTWEIKNPETSHIIYKHRTLGEIEIFDSEQKLNRALSKENNGAWQVVYKDKSKQNYFMVDKSGYFNTEFKKYNLTNI